MKQFFKRAVLILLALALTINGAGFGSIGRAYAEGEEIVENESFPEEEAAEEQETIDLPEEEVIEEEASEELEAGVEEEAPGEEVQSEEVQDEEAQEAEPQDEEATDEEPHEAEAQEEVQEVESQDETREVEPQEELQEAPDAQDAEQGEEIPDEPAVAAKPKALKAAGAPVLPLAAGSGYELQDANIQSVSVSKKNSDNEWESTTDIGDGDNVRFQISYKVEAGQMSSNKLYYTLPEGITNLDMAQHDIMNGTSVVGTYQIVQDGDRYVVQMELNDSIDYSNAFEGTVMVEGTVHKNDDGSNRVLHFSNGHEITVKAEKTVTDLLVYKKAISSASKTDGEDGENYVAFEYFIASKNGTNTITINDVSADGNIGVDVDVTKDSTITVRIGDYENPTDATFSASHVRNTSLLTTITIPAANYGNGVSYELPALGPNRAYWVQYTVPYKNSTEVNDGSKRVSNTVTAETANAPSASDRASLTVKSQAIKKGVSSDSNEITWTINVGRAGEDLAGWTMKDYMETDRAGLTLDPPATMTVVSGTGYSANEVISLTNGEYTFKEGDKGVITLTYTTPNPRVEGQVKITNHVSLEKGTEKYADQAEVNVMGVLGIYGLKKEGPATLGASAVSKTDDSITLDWKTTITLPGGAVDLSKIYYQDTVRAQTNNAWNDGDHWVTKRSLQDLVIKNSSGETLAFGTDYIVYAAFANSTDYATIKSYYDGTAASASAYNNAFRIDRENTTWLVEESKYDTHQNKFQILFISNDKIDDEEYLTIEYKTYGNLPEDKGDKIVYNNVGEIEGIKKEGNHTETIPESDIKFTKQVETKPGSETWADNATYTYKNSDNSVEYKVHIDFDPTQPVTPISFTDQLPEGLEYVAGSLRAEQVGYTGDDGWTFVEGTYPLTTISDSYNASTRELNIDINSYNIDYSFTAFGDPYTRQHKSIDVYYKVKLTDSTWDDTDTTRKQYLNTIIDNNDDTNTDSAWVAFTRPENPTTKGSATKDQSNESIQYEFYYLIVNPQGEDLNSSGDKLSIEDTISIPAGVEAEFQYEDFAVYEFNDQISDDPTVEEITSGAQLDSSAYKYVYDEKTHKLTAEVPDEQALVVVYSYKYTKTVDGAPSVTNTAKISEVDDSTSDTSTEIITNKSAATATQRDITVRKVEEGNTGKTLQGSEFELNRYIANRDSDGTLNTSASTGKKEKVGDFSSADTEPDEGTFTLILQNVIGDQGTSTANELSPYTLFELKETKAPTDYEKAADPIYFAWKDTSDSDDAAYTKLKTAYEKVKEAGWPEFPAQNDITFTTNRGTLNVGNTPKEAPSTYNLTIEKQTEKASTETFTFTVEITAAAGETPEPLPEFSDTNITKTAEGKYTVTVKAGESVTFEGIPEGYTYTISESSKTGWILVSVDDDTYKTQATGELTSDTTVTFKNKEDTVEVRGTKVWIDEGLTHNNASEITLTLKRSVTGGSEETVEATPTWSGNSYVFSDLPKADGSGNVYTYTVEEADIPNYTATQVGNNFSNKKDAGELTVSKVIKGNAASADDEFTFTIKLTKSNGQPFSGTIDGITFASGVGTFTLKGGESKTINTYVGVTYEVSEDPAGYYSEDGTKSGTISSTASTATFTNTKVKKSLPLELTKNLDGAAASTADQFTFTMKGTSPDTNTYDKTAKNNASGKATFDGIEYTQDDAGKTYTYEIKETVLAGYECDSSIYTVTDQVEWNGDKTDITVNRTIKKGSANATEVTFDNYTLIEISGTKTWVDGGLTHTNSSEVTLTLKRSIAGGSEETVTATPTWTGDTYKYTDLRKTDDDGNLYTYTVTEAKIRDYEDPEYSNYDITNTREQGDLTIEKEITGNDTSASDEFTFTITLKDKDGNLVSGSVSGEYTPDGGTAQDVTLNFADGVATYKLKGGDKLTLTYYVGTTYEVEETDKKDYTNSDGKKTGTLTTTESQVKFTNTRDTYGDLAIKKILAGNDQDTSKEFTFTVTLKDKDDQPIANTAFGDYTTDAEGKITLSIKGGETKTITDLPNGTKYEVAEDDYSSEGYDPVQLSTNKTGTIAGDLPDNSLVTVTATNKKDTYGDIKVKKVETGNDTGAVEEFEFTAIFTDGDDNPVADLTVGSYTTDSEGKITFTVKAGEEETLTSIPNGTKYVIEEKDYSSDGYDNVSWSDTPSGTIVGATGDNSLVEFTATNNRDTYGDIVIKKVETGNDTGEVEDFEFTITAKDQNGDPIEGTYGDATFEQGEAVVTVKAGESLNITDLPNGTTYTIEEKDYADQGYDEVKWEDEAPEGLTIVGGQGTNSEVTFTATNNRDTYGDVEITKVETGNDPGEVEEFEFTVTAEDAEGEPLEGTYGAAEFEAGVAVIAVKAGETVRLEGLPNGAVYTIEEKDYTDRDYDPVVWSGDEPVSQTIEGAQGTNSLVSFTATNNRDTYGDLTVRKELKGDGVDETKEFIFTVTLSDTDIEGTYGDMDFTAGVATFTLKGGESATAEGLPNGIEYEVEEDDYSDLRYETSTDESLKGTIVGKDSIETVVTNTKYALGNLTIEKIIRGTDANPEDEFTFEIRLSDASVSGTFSDVEFKDGVATVTLKGGESITIEDLPTKDMEYKVTETDDRGYEQSAEGDSGEMVMDGEVKAVFTNTRDAGETSYSVEKIWDDDNDAAGNRPKTISVQLYADGEKCGDEVILKASDGWNYTWTELPRFKNGEEIAYTADEVEVPEGYKSTADSSEEGKTVITNSFSTEPEVPGDDDQDKEPRDGDDTPKEVEPGDKDKTPEPPEKPKTPEKPSVPTRVEPPKKASPKTGDDSDPALYMGLMAASLICLMAAKRYRRRTK